MIRITDSLSIPDDEIDVSVSTSSGPGGQNVNRVRTRVGVAFNVKSSGSLTDDERERIFEKLGSRIDSHGNLRVRSQRHRTQHQNREDALGRLAILIADALREIPERKKTRKPKGARERRLETKRRRARIKELRGQPPDTD